MLSRLGGLYRFPVSRINSVKQATGSLRFLSMQTDHNDRDKKSNKNSIPNREDVKKILKTKSHEVRRNIREHTDEKYEQRLEKLYKATQTVPVKIKSKTNEQVAVATRNVLSMAYLKFKDFVKEYKYVATTMGFVTFGSVVSTSYMSCRYGIIDYHSWSWLPLEHFEQTVCNASSKYLNYEIEINRKAEDLIASILIAKVTKPLQWVFIYNTTPTVAKIFRSKRDEYKEKL